MSAILLQNKLSQEVKNMKSCIVAKLIQKMQIKQVSFYNVYKRLEGGK